MLVLKVMPGVDPCAGAEQSFAATAPGLIARGIRLHLVVFNQRQGLVADFERAGGVVHDLSSCSSWWSRYRALGRVIDAIQPDVVHATLWEAVVPAQLAARRRGVPVLVTWANVGSWARSPGAARHWKLRLVQLLDTLLARLTGSWFHAVTEGVARENAPALRVPSSRVRVVERGRDVQVDAPDGAAVLELRRSLRIPPAAPIVVAVGRQEPQKDHVTLVRAIDAAARRGAELHLLLAGRDGLASDAIRRAIAESDVGDRVHLLGHRDDVPTVLASADVFALSSRYEGAAGSAIEAMRAGLPIVSTEVSGLRGVLVHGVNALLVPVGDPDATAGALIELVADRALASRLGAEARRTFERRFTLERATDGLEALYKEMVRV